MIGRKSPDSKGSILIVDDERLIRWSLHERLSRAGYEVLEAQDAKETLEQIGNGANSVDLILLDLKLPDADGMTLLKRLRGICPHSAVIMMSAHGTDDSAEEAIASGASYFIRKPFRFDDMLKLVGSTLTGCA